MKVYIAGPMSGIPQGNVPAFDCAAKSLRKRGYEVVSPTETDPKEHRARMLASKYWIEDSWGRMLGDDVALIADEGIEAIVVLPGWRHSRGARLETFVARLCGIPVLHYRAEDPLRKVATTSLDHAHAGGTQ